MRSQGGEDKEEEQVLIGPINYAKFHWSIDVYNSKSDKKCDVYIPLPSLGDDKLFIYLSKARSVSSFLACNGDHAVLLISQILFVVAKSN